VVAIDNSPIRLALARHNATIYGVADRIEFILADYISFAHAYLSIPSQRQTRKIDVVFLSPPWGGPSYFSGPGTSKDTPTILAAEQAPTEATYPEYTLASIQPIHGAKIFQLSRQISPNVAYFLPRNTKLEEISALLTHEKTRKGKAPDKGEESHEMVEVEEEWMGTKLKALTCYFGGLAAGQEHLY
jgi:trimethylguanosine synthase